MTSSGRPGPEHRWAVGDRVVWPHRENVGLWRGYDLRSVGTVTAVDLPGKPLGVQVAFDAPVNGVMTCYATHQELEPAGEATS